MNFEEAYAGAMRALAVQEERVGKLPKGGEPFEKIQKTPAAYRKQRDEAAARRDIIAVLYRRGKTRPEMAELLGVSKSAIGHDLHSLRRTGRIPARRQEMDAALWQRRESVFALSRKGLSTRDISDETGLTLDQVYRDLRAMRDEE